MHKTYRYTGKNIRAFLKRIPHIRKKALDILSPSFPKNSVSKYTSVIPFDPLLDWQDIKHEAPTLATPEAFELYLCVLLAPLFSPNGKPKDSISKEWDKFISKYSSICLAHVPLDILIQFTYMYF